MAIMEEDCVSFETAKLLKEKGFKGWCSKSYGMDVRYKGRTIDFDEECELKDEGYGDDIEYIDGGMLYHSGWDNSDENEKIYAAPTLSVTMKWLREVHDFNINTELNIRGYFCSLSHIVRDFSGHIIDIEDSEAWETAYYDSYEQAVEAAIKYYLENLI